MAGSLHRQICFFDTLHYKLDVMNYTMYCYMYQQGCIIAKLEGLVNEYPESKRYYLRRRIVQRLLQGKVQIVSLVLLKYQPP